MTRHQQRFIPVFFVCLHTLLAGIILLGTGFAGPGKIEAQIREDLIELVKKMAGASKPSQASMRSSFSLLPQRKPIQIKNVTADSDIHSFSSKNGVVKNGVVKAGITKKGLYRQGTALSTCHRLLESNGIVYQAVPDIRKANGCKLENAVKIQRIGDVEIKPPAVLNCDMAVRTAKWLDRAQTYARFYFESSIRRLEHMSAYSCRFRPSGKLSEHASGNALDIGGLVLLNGIKTTVLYDWYRKNTADSIARSRFWYDLAGAGCDVFNLVLSPVSNAAHKNHLHFDAGRWKLCER